MGQRYIATDKSRGGGTKPSPKEAFLAKRLGTVRLQNDASQVLTICAYVERSSSQAPSSRSSPPMAKHGDNSRRLATCARAARCEIVLAEVGRFVDLPRRRGRRFFLGRSQWQDGRLTQKRPKRRGKSPRRIPLSQATPANSEASRRRCICKCARRPLTGKAEELGPCSGSVRCH